ncbi:hypothetical protein OQ483_24330 (plasmid) [Enterobacter bugandensis]|uniref:leucine-rich repeat domain-containing protein n=1 Tax=Enterobacter bugandensis TaxID=881260 RepID=UPI00283AB5E7|nr:leucine-rich repeat domain-containing protein [Enterobacter bugandensis]WMU75492.1 hypothetical protein OQ483_24330 [Enterobacter bugandensis]
MVNYSPNIHNSAKSTEISFPAEIKDIFPDATLAEEVAADLGKNVNDKVTQDELLAVKGVVVISPELEGIQYLKGLETLDCSGVREVSGKSISDITLLSGLTNLYAVSLDNNDIIDVSPLKRLINLTSLSLTNNKVGDVSALRDLVKMESLDLSNENLDGFTGSNHVSDISPLNNMKALSYLNLNKNSVSNFSAIHELKDVSLHGDEQLIELPKTPERQHHLILRNKDGSDVKIEPGSTGHYNNDTVYWNNEGENKLIFSGEHISGVVKEITT